ncbi:MAG: glycosyltransferase [Bacteroidetes bacterium]|nr:glycosyltransferase [Bacteroidota bacterium]
MKILHLIDSGGLYGAEIMLLNLATEQRKIGLSPVIGSIRKKGIPEKPIETEAMLRGLILKTFDMKPGPNIMGALDILRYARRENIDILHSHGYKTNIMLGFLPLWVRRIPIISTLHGWTSTGGWSKMRINEELDAFSLRFVDQIVLVNQGMLDKPKIRSLPHNKISVINNGIDFSYHEKSEEDTRLFAKIRQFTNTGHIIGSIGRLSIEKGFNYLLEAVRTLRQEYNEDVRLLLIGDGKLRQDLEKKTIAMGLEEYVMITGFIKNAKILLNIIDIYVISSLTEGLPITLLEAMASKTPVVATAVGGIPYVAQDEVNALLVPPMDSHAIVSAIRRLRNESELKDTLVRNSSFKVKREYHSLRMAEKYYQLYSKILK